MVIMIHRTPSMMDETSMRLIKLLMAISLGIFSVLFLYVFYNLVSGIAGSLVALLFFITVAFFIILLKVFKMFHQFANYADTTNAELRSRNEADTLSLPPSYEEAVKNQSAISTISCNLVPMYPTAVQTVSCSSSYNNKYPNEMISNGSTTTTTTTSTTVIIETETPPSRTTTAG